MVGEAILGAILKRLGSFALEEINLARGVKEELEKLKETVLMTEAVISHAENKQVKEKPVEIWLNKLKDLAYEADDILDEYAYDLMHHHEGLNHMRDQVHSFFFLFEAIRSFFSKSSNLLSSGHEIKDLNQKFDQLASLRDKLGLKILNVGSSSYTMGVDHGSHEINHRETYAFVDESKVLGREVDKSNIINMLLANKSSSSCNQNDKISVIPVVGMGGLGKTTLAQLVYNDIVVDNHFDLRIWVCVSDVFVVKKIFLNIIESITCTKFDGGSENFIVNELQQRLGGKKFLLVLDDVWNEKDNEWKKLKIPLVVGAEGSKILITTRSENVASIVLTGEFPSYKLQTLRDDICLSIFEQRAFGPSCNAVKTPTLVEIGKELVRKCGGLPLAVEALGSLMRSKKEVREWEVIRDSKIWDNNPENPNKILPALKLSYDHLLPQVKPCFSYCSMFPKDSKIKRGTLIRLWVAEGFIQPFEGDERLMEEIGDGYFNNLLWNSFFQGVGTNKDGEITEVKMHDLIHDLAQSVAGTHECSIMEASEMGDISEIRRLNLLNVNEESSAAIATATVVSKDNKLRTLFIQTERRSLLSFKFSRFGKLLFSEGERRIDSLLNNNKRLRVLDLSYSNIEELPASIGDLKHLRYLDLSWCKNLKKIPDSITRLYNLQTLNLEGCRKLKEFPNDLNKLINLRHLLHYKRGWELKVGQLTCLQTLSGGFRVPEEDNGGGGGVGQLQRLDLLGGSLEITGLEREIEANAEKANLKAKKSIKELHLHWKLKLESYRVVEYAHSLVLEGLQPHPNLRVLEIEGFMGLKFPTWMNNLQNLVHLQLRFCKRCKQLPALPSSLRFLEIQDMELLEEWQQLSIVSSSSSSSFSSSYLSLESIAITECPKLKSMPTEFFSLKEFRVDRISNGMGLVSSIVRSNLHTLTKLDIWNVFGLEFLPLVGLLKDNNVLESLKIINCPDFKGFIQEEEEGDEDLLLLSSSSLHTLELHECPNLTLLPGNLRGLTSLRSLELCECPNLTLLPGNLRGLTSLRSLVVVNCVSIELCPILKNMFTGFPSMEKLSLRNTSGLVFLPLGLLKGNNVFKELRIRNCPDFQGFIQEEEEEGDEDLSVVISRNSNSNSSLRVLWLIDCPVLRLLPDLKYLTSLSYLKLIDCPVLRLLPDLKDLTSLYYVRIEGCNEDLVISLPNGVENQSEI